MPPRRSTVRVHIHPLGDTALIAELGTRLDSALNTRAIALAAALKKRRDVHQAVVGAVSVTVSFDPELISHDALGAAIRRLATRRPPPVTLSRGGSGEIFRDTRMTAVLRVQEPGLFTTIQDLGRPQAVASGVPPGGAMDRFAHTAANFLVGNDRGAASLECTLVG